jgi:hypothetical protein
LENVLKDYHGVLVTPTEELLVFRLYGNDGKLYLRPLSQRGASWWYDGFGTCRKQVFLRSYHVDDLPGLQVVREPEIQLSQLSP